MTDSSPGVVAFNPTSLSPLTGHRHTVLIRTDKVFVPAHISTLAALYLLGDKLLQTSSLGAITYCP